MRWSSLTAIVVASSAPVLAQPFPPPPDYGLDWVTIGAPGNDPVPEEMFLLNSPPPTPLGTVDYEYRIMRTEITTSQWLEFVEAYVVVFGDQGASTGFHGRNIGWTGSGYAMQAPPDFPNTMSWEFAARYCNWLHNGKALTAEAFENGAYDASTFSINPDGTRNHQLGHDPDALFWIPTHDEWVKAAYYDPDRFGPGQGGWWYQPGSQDELLVSGMPGAGETNAGAQGGETPIGSYPQVVTPWGLLDASGGENEWTETASEPIFKRMIWRSSDAANETYERDDPIDSDNRNFPTNPFIGLRLASAIQVPRCPGDANIDGEVDFSDVTTVLGNWLGDGTTGGDANGDGLVNFNDITTILGNWLAPCL